MLRQQVDPEKVAVICVSLDEDGLQLVRFLEETGMKTWPQVCDLKGFGGDLAVAYAVQGAGVSFLIDQHGVVVDQNLHGPQLKQRLLEVISRK